MQHAFDVVRQLLFLREVEQLAHDIQRRGAGVDCQHGITQSRNHHLSAPEATGQTFPVQVQREIDACQVIIKVVRVTDPEIDTEPLFEHRRVQRCDVGNEHLRWLAFYEPGGAAGKQKDRGQQKQGGSVNAHSSHHSKNIYGKATPKTFIFSR